MNPLVRDVRREHIQPNFPRPSWCSTLQQKKGRRDQKRPMLTKPIIFPRTSPCTLEVVEMHVDSTNLRENPNQLTTTIYVQYLEDMYYSLWHNVLIILLVYGGDCKLKLAAWWDILCWAQPGWRVVDSLIKQGWCALTTCTCSPGVTKKSLKHCHIGLTWFKWYLVHRLLQVGCVQLAKESLKISSVGWIHHPTQPMMIQTLLPSVTSLPG